MGSDHWQWVVMIIQATKVTLDKCERAAARGGFHFGVVELMIVAELTLDHCELKQFDALFEKSD